MVTVRTQPYFAPAMGEPERAREGPVSDATPEKLEVIFISFWFLQHGMKLTSPRSFRLSRCSVNYNPCYSS